MIVNLIRAEFCKFFGRPASLYLTIFILGMSLFAPIVLAIMGTISPVTYYNAVRVYLPFPNSLSIYNSFISIFGAAISCFLVCDCFGSEYSYDTWKMILPRTAKRSAFIGAKIIAMLIIIPGVFLAGELLYNGGAIVCAKIMHISTRPHPTWVAEASVGLSFRALNMLFYSTLAVLVTLVARSTVAGVLTGLFSPVIFNLLVFKQSAPILPSFHFDNIRAHWLGGDLFILKDMLKYEMSPYISIAVLLGYTIALAIIANRMFCRRNVVGA